MFVPDPNFDKEKVKQELGLREHVFLFFGFIRKYKGLHNVIPAFAKLTNERDDVSLLIVGESFWNTLDSNKLSTRIKKVVYGTEHQEYGNKKTFDIISYIYNLCFFKNFIRCGAFVFSSD